MDNAKKELTTEELVARVRKGKEWRDKGRVKTVIAMGNCDFTFALPPTGILERKLAACKDGGAKKVESLITRLAGKSPKEVAAIYAEYQNELATSQDEIAAAENEVYADYVEDIRDRTISPEGKSFVKIAFLGGSGYLADTEELPLDTPIPFSREITLFLMEEQGTRNWIIQRVSNVTYHNLFRRETALGNSEPSRNGAPVESQPAPNAPNVSSSNTGKPAAPSSTCISTTPENSSTGDEGNS